MHACGVWVFPAWKVRGWVWGGWIEIEGFGGVDCGLESWHLCY